MDSAVRLFKEYVEGFDKVVFTKMFDKFLSSSLTMSAEEISSLVKTCQKPFPDIFGILYQNISFLLIVSNWKW